MSLDDIYIIDKRSAMLCESERAQLEVEAFDAVRGGGRVNKYRRNSIISRLPPDIALDLHEREEADRIRASAGSMEEAGHESRERMSLSEKAPKKSPKRASSMSPKNIYRRMSKSFGGSSSKKPGGEVERPSKGQPEAAFQGPSSLPAELTAPDARKMERTSSLQVRRVWGLFLANGEPPEAVERGFLKWGTPFD